MRVLIIALDGATFDLLAPWFAAGYLPTLKKIYQDGNHAPLMSIFPPITAAAWSSFATGKNPAKHGIFEFLQRKSDSYQVEPMTGAHRQGKTLWRILSEANKRVIVINVPVTYPPEPVNGYLVAGMPVPTGRKDFTSPPELANEVLNWIPDYPINATSVYIRGKAEDFLTDIRHELDARLTVAQNLMKRDDWDFAMLHILGTDRIQHEFWHCMDETHPEHQGEALQYKNAILDYYQEIDRRLGEILGFADENTTTFIISDHGFGPLHQFVYLNSWLLKEGLLVLKRDAFTRLKKITFQLGFSPTNIYKVVEKLGMAGVRGGMDMGRRQQLLDTLFLSFQDVDWSKTKAYARGNFGQIFINLKGREPQGIISEGIEYERTVNDIIGRLETLTDPRNGKKLVSHAKKRDDIFSGDLLHRAPDIAVFMADETNVPLGTADFPANVIVEKAIGNTGDHRFNGILMMQGRGIKSGELPSANLIDIAPTVLHLLGLSVPIDMDGQVLTGALGEEFQTVEFAEQLGSTETAQQAGYSAAEEAEILQHLQDLGYLG